MAYSPSAVAPHDFAPAIPERGLLRRFIHTMMASRQRQVEREIARYLMGSGGKFTDGTEREIERRFLSKTPRW